MNLAKLQKQIDGGAETQSFSRAAVEMRGSESASKLDATAPRQAQKQDFKLS